MANTYNERRIASSNEIKRKIKTLVDTRDNQKDYDPAQQELDELGGKDIRLLKKGKQAVSRHRETRFKSRVNIVDIN